MSDQRVAPEKTEPRTGDDRIALLRRSTVFAGLQADVVEALAERLSERSYSRGETVWQAGEPGEELIVVIRGELAVMGSLDSGELLGRIGPGECAGEMALILDEPRSATVVCTRNARVLAVGRDDFQRFVRDDPVGLANLVQLLSRRAVSLARRRPVSLTPGLVGVVADPGVPGASLVAAAIARSAAEILGGPGLLVRLGGRGVPLQSLADGDPALGQLPVADAGRAVLDVDVGEHIPLGGSVTTHSDYAGGAKALAAGVDAMLEAFGDRYRVVVIDFPPVASGGLQLADATCASIVHVRAEPGASPEVHARVFQVVNRFAAHGRPLPLNHCEPFVLPVEPALATWALHGAPESHEASSTPGWRAIHRLTRKIAGATVGVALGGGGAFGIAHVGVLLALADAGIPVDLVAGTSMGSIVALGYAAGLPAHTMVEIAQRIGNVRTAVSAIDPSLSGTGLLTGRRMVSIFGPFFPHETFDDLEIPCRVVAMDVETGCRVDIGSGRIDEAFRASCSIPVVFAPVRIGSQTLVDGGMIDPVPADVARDMGADIVIGVNVVPQLKAGTTTAISRTFKRVNRLNPLSYVNRTRGMPDIVDILMNSLQATQFELGNFKALSADVLVNVDLAEFTWIDFHRALDIIERGRSAGKLVLDDVRAVIDRRLRPAS
jgi:NTE family protein